MRRVRWIGLVALMLTLPGVALAAGSSANSAAQKQCRTEQLKMGAVTFKATYGSNAFGKCVSHRTAQNTSDQNSAQTSAEKQCRTQQNSPTGGFATEWGTEPNAFGKCVSTTAKMMSDKAEATQVSDEDNAAKQCRSEQSRDAAAFKTKYGTNANDSNAFGKCVSQKAKTMEQQQSAS